MGFSAAGSDIEPRMGEYTIANLNWLIRQFPDILQTYGSWQLGDATMLQWQQTKVAAENNLIADTVRLGMNPLQIGAVASETYLGRPFTSTPDPETLKQTMADCNLIIKKFLKNIHPQLARGTRLCLAAELSLNL